MMHTPTAVHHIYHIRSPTDPGTKVVKRLTGAEREWRTRRYVYMHICVCMCTYGCMQLLIEVSLPYEHAHPITTCPACSPHPIITPPPPPPPQPPPNKNANSTGVRQEPIPEGFCWVTGDNPLFSEDSSLYGPIPLALIEGRVRGCVWVCLGVCGGGGVAVARVLGAR